MRNSFTLRFLQQADVIQLTDGGERLCAALQLTAEVDVACPVTAHAHIIHKAIHDTVNSRLNTATKKTKDEY